VWGLKLKGLLDGELFVYIFILKLRQELNLLCVNLKTISKTIVYHTKVLDKTAINQILTNLQFKIYIFGEKIFGV